MQSSTSLPDSRNTFDEQQLKDLLNGRVLGQKTTREWPPLARPPRFRPIGWPDPPIVGFPPPILFPGKIEPPRPTIPPDPLTLLKAYADALRPSLTIENDLSRVNQAVFITTPLQYGIPASVYPPEFINDAVFKLADSIQSGISPAFNIGGPSYVGYLSSYVENIGELPPLVKEARENYLVAKAASEAEYDKMFAKFKEVFSLNPQLQLTEWIEKDTGRDYRDAVAERNRLSDAFSRLQGASLSAVIKAREMLDSAQDRDSSTEGNMPCALRDLDRSLVPSGDAGVLYRPLHYLGGFNLSSRRWIDEHGEAATSPRRIQIDLLGANNMTWKSLGFPQLDQESPVAADLRKYFGNGSLTIRCTGLASFDVFRGLWNIDGFRTILPPLFPSAPERLKEPVFKTSKFLVGYDVEVVLELDALFLEALDSPGADGKYQVFPDLFGDIPFNKREDTTGKVVLHAGLGSNNAYPVLLALLAEKV
ncbi:hypothetical protein P154DRAFT_527201 [Amniculicola lignicola CBS 123094]|uniref:Uncharacterized protein n=1 Tax=Amniculicola lignicola CBS 123094 TaxID=1392246 RepID=A0A6A5VXF3_9PLEO|nr:hypothetical protein P154DRAFT_527201 [Amniculicola lignicola CBS 123094]